MREMTLEEIRKTEIEILDVIAKFCDERKINYWIDCGTLLGAIRHKGFIPWDDDIDVGMLRPDYERFMNEFNGYNPQYELRCFENDSKWIFSFGKVCDTETFVDEGRREKFGVSVDIFVYDNAPDDDNILRKMLIKRDILNKMNSARLHNILKPTKGNIFRKISVHSVRLILRLFSRYYFVEKLIENSKRYVLEDTKRVGNFSVWGFGYCSKDVFDSFIDVEFEGKKYKAPIGYDKWLRAQYGDYMQLPPVEKRVRTHPFAAYRKTSV